MAAPNPSILWYFLLRSILIVPELALVGCKSGSCESRFDWSPVVNKTCTFLLDIESNKNALVTAKSNRKTVTNKW